MNDTNCDKEASSDGTEASNTPCSSAFLLESPAQKRLKLDITMPPRGHHVVPASLVIEHDEGDGGLLRASKGTSTDLSLTLDSARDYVLSFPAAAVNARLAEEGVSSMSTLDVSSETSRTDEGCTPFSVDHSHGGGGACNSACASGRRTTELNWRPLLLDSHVGGRHTGGRRLIDEAIQTTSKAPPHRPGPSPTQAGKLKGALALARAQSTMLMGETSPAASRGGSSKSRGGTPIGGGAYKHVEKHQNQPVTPHADAGGRSPDNSNTPPHNRGARSAQGTSSSHSVYSRSVSGGQAHRRPLSADAAAYIDAADASRHNPTRGVVPTHPGPGAAHGVKMTPVAPPAGYSRAAAAANKSAVSVSDVLQAYTAAGYPPPLLVPGMLHRLPYTQLHEGHDDVLQSTTKQLEQEEAACVESVVEEKGGVKSNLRGSALSAARNLRKSESGNVVMKPPPRKGSRDGAPSSSSGGNGPKSRIRTNFSRSVIV